MLASVVVFDTSVLIPLIIPASRSTRLFSRLERAGRQVALTPEILDEAAEKLRTKEPLRRWLGLSDRDIEEFIEYDLPVKTTVVAGVRHAHGSVKADPKDEKIVAAALESGASYIITEDRHLLDMHEFEGVRIMNRQQFESELNRLGVPSAADEE